MIQFTGSVASYEYQNGDQVLYCGARVFAKPGILSSACYSGLLMNIEFVGSNKQLGCVSEGVDWRKPVRVTIENVGQEQDDRVVLGEFECEQCKNPAHGCYPISEPEIASKLETFDKPGKWRVAAERVEE